MSVSRVTAETPYRPTRGFNPGTRCLAAPPDFGPGFTRSAACGNSFTEGGELMVTRRWRVRPFGVLAVLALVYAADLVLGSGGAFSGGWLVAWAAGLAAASLLHVA